MELKSVLQIRIIDNAELTHLPGFSLRIYHVCGKHGCHGFDVFCASVLAIFFLIIDETLLAGKWTDMPANKVGSNGG